MSRKRRTAKGFTLLELIVAVVVIGILSTIGIPSFASVIGKSQDRTALLNLKAITRNLQSLTVLENDDVFKNDKIVTSAQEANFTALAENVISGQSVTFTESSKYGEIGVGVGGNSTIIVLTMKSNSGRCVYLKSNLRAIVDEGVSSDKPASCTVGDLIDTIPTNPGEPEESDPYGTVNPITDDPTTRNPDDADFDSPYCQDNGCAFGVLRDAQTLQMKWVEEKRDSVFRGMALDDEHQRLIVSDRDGIHFMNWESGTTELIYPTNEQLEDLVYFHGGDLFANDGERVQQFKVSQDDITLVDPESIKRQFYKDGGDRTSSYLNTVTLTGETVNGQDYLYMATRTGEPLSGEHDPDFHPGAVLVARNIVGEGFEDPIAYVPASAPTLDVCSISVDKDYIYIRGAEMGIDSTADGKVSGIWRLTKNASNINLEQTPLWVEMNQGCDVKPVQAEMGSSGGTVYLTDGLGTLMSVQANKKMYALAGEAQIAFGTEGKGKEVSLGIIGNKLITSIIPYKDRMFIAVEGSIFLMAPSDEPVNNLSSANITPGTTSTLFADVGQYLGRDGSRVHSLAYSPLHQRFYGQGYQANGDYAGLFSTENGDAIAESAAQPSPGNPYFSGWLLKVGNQSVLPHKGYISTDLYGSGPNNCANGLENDPERSNRDRYGVLWCLDQNGLTSYQIPTMPEVNPISNINLISSNINDEVVYLSVNDGQAYVLTLKDSPTGQKYQLSRINITTRTVTILNEVAFGTRSDGVNHFQGLGPVGVADTRTALFVPAANGILRIDKSNQAPALVVNLGADQPAVTSVTHDGHNLYYLTAENNMYKLN